MDHLTQILESVTRFQQKASLTPFAAKVNLETTDKFYGPYLQAVVEDSFTNESGECPELVIHSFHGDGSEKYHIHLDFKEFEDEATRNVEVILRLFINEASDITTFSVLVDVNVKNAGVGESELAISVNLYEEGIPDRPKGSGYFKCSEAKAVMIATNVEAVNKEQS